MVDKNSIKKMAKTLVGVASNDERKKPEPYDTSATVRRIDGNIAYVHISDGVDETPVKRTISAQPGDVVQVRVSGRDAWLVGNASSPPTDDTTAIRARTVAVTAQKTAIVAKETAEEAQDYAEEASASAKRAKDAADEANGLLEEMNDAAIAADTTLTNIYKDASDAKISAAEAKTNADIAQLYADSASDSAASALGGLSYVEQVLNTVTWFAEHGTYSETDDTQPEIGKLYFEETAEGYVVADVSGIKTDYYIYSHTEDTTIDITKLYYTVVASSVSEPDIDNLYIYYELIDGDYVLTKDTTIVEGKNYYTLEGTEILDPDVSDIGSYYEAIGAEHIDYPDPSELGLYELTNVDDSISNFILTHLVLLQNGLMIYGDNESGNVLLTTSGVVIRDKNNNELASYGENTIIGDKNSTHIEIGNNSLEFFAGSSIDNDPVAYISNEKLWIPHAVVVNSMQVGNTDDGAWQWKIHETTRNLRLVWIGE